MRKQNNKTKTMHIELGIDQLVPHQKQRQTLVHKTVGNMKPRKIPFVTSVSPEQTNRFEVIPDRRYPN